MKPAALAALERAALEFARAEARWREVPQPNYCGHYTTTERTRRYDRRWRTTMRLFAVAVAYAASRKSAGKRGAPR